MLYCTFTPDGRTELRNDSSDTLPVGGYALSDGDYGDLMLGISVASLVSNPDGTTSLSITPYVAPVPTLNETKTTQIQLISQACQQAIIAGFESTALGSPYFYPSGLIDQQNLAANVLSSLMPSNPPGWYTLQLCGTVATPAIWGYIPHTSSQIQQVGIDAKAAIMANLVKNATLAAQINAIIPSSDPIADNAIVRAIVWG